MIWRTSSTSSAETEKLGELLGSRLKGGEVIELLSDLGGGKTTFVKGLAHGAGSKNKVSSPTFTLNRVYNAGKLMIYHFDFYRLSDPGILSDQLAEAIDDEKAVVVIEWADIIKNVLPDERIHVELRPMADNPDEREIIITYPPSRRELISKLESEWQETRP